MSNRVAAELRALSRVAFGQTYRLEVMLAVADSQDGIVNLTDLARELGQSTSNIQGPLRSLVELGLVSAAPQGDSKRKHYIRNPSSAWQWAREMRAEAIGVAAVPTSRAGLDPPVRVGFGGHAATDASPMAGHLAT